MDIKQPIIHDRHIVKQAFEHLIMNGPVEFQMPEDLTIATCRNEGSLEDRIIPHLSGYEEQSILERNMEYLGLDLVVLRDARLPWRNTFKFEMLNDYLKDCPTEYFMCLDAIDVIWVDEPQKVMDIFKSFDCDVLFMSTHSTDGYNCMPEVKQWVETINVSGRYLNSGVYIGKTSFVKEMVGDAMKYAIPHGVTMGGYREYLKSQPEDYPKGSQDQDIFRYLEPDFYPRLRVDYDNLMVYRS
jgi:hypothetical protein|tara:strand:- start:304 stop:1029 length:726 start_codon:yes stop_codon:yes gene_type:complete